MRETNAALVEHLVGTGALKTDRLIKAFLAVDRKDFVTEECRELAYEDDALPIGHRQTISQPSTVTMMLEYLDPKPGDKVLDIGSGSGWTTALLGSVVGPRGSVLGLERLLPLVTFGRQNIAKYPFNTQIEKAARHLGAPERAPFDRILVSAAAEAVPEDLVSQLAVGGRMVIPVGSELCEVERKDVGYESACHGAFAFVPLL